jgi:recombinational DNA repair ATPase RecF
MSNERQEYVLFKARMEFETAREDRNKHLDEGKKAKSLMKLWGEQLDVMNGKLATEAVEYINVLQAAYESRGYEIEELKTKVQNQSSQTKEVSSTTDNKYPVPLGTPIYGGPDVKRF